MGQVGKDASGIVGVIDNRILLPKKIYYLGGRYSSFFPMMRSVADERALMSDRDYHVGKAYGC